jgi:hypothetical protein
MIIESRNGHIVRTPEPGSAQGGHCSEGHLVGVTEDRCRNWAAAGEKFLHRSLTVYSVAVARPYDIATVDVEAGFSDGVSQAVSPLVPDVIIGLGRHSSVKDADVAMTQ